MKSILLLAFILFCCQMNAQSGKAKSLEIGNKWVYLHSSLDSSYWFFEVIGDTVIESNNYAILSLTYSWGGTTQYVYERADTNKLFRYVAQSGYEKVLVDFSLEIGDSVSSYVVTGKDYVNIWGESFIKMCLFYNYPGLDWYDDCYIEKIGLVWEEGDGIAIQGYYLELEAALIEYKVYGDTTLLGFEEPIQLPYDFSLFQNYPNPFNPTTSIQYALSSMQFVTLKVYDVLGNEIATLVNEEKSPGDYKVKFDGIGLPSGIYFYQLRVGHFLEIKKMVIMK